MTFKPGDYALCDFVFEFSDARGVLARLDDQMVWRSVGGHQVSHRLAENIGSIRPVVVIDPEDRVQVFALVEAMPPEWELTVSSVQSALRSLLADPKPEPLGLGAVVEVPDQYGGTKRIVRADLSDAPWWDGEAGESLAWADLPRPIKVLSEGVVTDA